MSTSRYGNHSLRGDGASLWNKLFKEFFSKPWFDFLPWTEIISYETIPTDLRKWIVNFWNTFKQFPLDFLSWTFFYEL